LPLLRPLDDHPNVFAVLGCGGNGITFSMVAAELVSSWVKGRRDPDADLFRG
jgi:glycine/D-amino acid oxidase-like deaminating enzyme